MPFSSKRNETACAREHPRIATTQWDRISMAPFQLPLKNESMYIFKRTGIGAILFFLFSKPDPPQSIRGNSFEVTRLMNPTRIIEIIFNMNYLALSLVCTKTLYKSWYKMKHEIESLLYFNFNFRKDFNRG